jgi:hypothetical protein
MMLELGSEMGIEDVEVYVTEQKPKVVAAEVTAPISIVLGKTLAQADKPLEIRFWAARCLKLASAHLAGPLQLGEERFGVLLVGILRQFQPTFCPDGVNEEDASGEQQRLRRLIPSSMLQELGPYALSLATPDFDHREIWAAIRDAGNRAGLLACGSAEAAVTALSRAGGYGDVHAAMQADEIARLIRFAVSEDHVRLWAGLMES